MYPTTGVYNNYYENTNGIIFDCFEDKKVRRIFIRKTFLLFLLSMASTFGSCLGFKYINGADNFLVSVSGQGITVLSFVAIFITTFITICCDYLLRRNPIKYIIYIIFTLSISWSIGSLAVYVEGNQLIAAIAITTGTTTSLTLYALITKTDFTGYFEYFLILFFVILITSFVNVFLFNKFLHIFIIGVGCLAFSLLIVHDVQMIVAQKHIRYKFSLDDYILASMCLYLDTINFFIYTLNCLMITDN